MDYSGWLSGRSRAEILMFSLVLLVLIAFFDYLTGAEIASSIFYLGPVSLLVWYIDLRWGIIVAIISAGLWMVLNFVTAKEQMALSIHYWNAGVRLGMFLIVAFVLDARKHSEAGLRKAKETAEELAANLNNANIRLQEAMKVKSRFTSMVSHELRTPLTAIKEGIGVVLDESTGSINEEQHEFLHLAKRNVDRLHRLINDVLEFSRLESGKVSFTLKNISLQPVINDVLALHQAAAAKQGLVLRAEFADNNYLVRCDVDKIQQVLNNLLSNALKYTEWGEIMIRTSCQDGVLKVGVKDTGIGIDKEHLGQLFHEFEQINETAYRRPGGTGLGLAISKEIVEGHGGSIWVESDGETGSEFFFTLPLAEAGGTA
ncbi:MAG: HAMP domain-containing sensor histidine kinase [bacterium]